MNLLEFEGKELLKEYGAPIPKGELCGSLEEVKEYTENNKEGEWALKAQVPVGKRGKHGGILFANAKNLDGKVEELFKKEIQGYSVKQILVDEKIDLKKELYLSLTLDRANKQYLWVFAAEGGMEIEEIAASHPKSIVKIAVGLDNPLPVEDIQKALLENFSQEIVHQILEISKKCWDLVKQKEALLVEINPLMLSKDDKIFAGDAKIIIDSNALFRHEDLWKYRQSKNNILEVESKEKGIPYVELDGDIGVIGNGAGLVMATLDMINTFDGKPANFLDIGGGASKEKTEQALEIVMKSGKVQGLLINIFGGITHCDTVAEAVVEFKNNMPRKVPMVLRMVGTNEEKAEELLNKADIHFYTSMEKAVKKIISLVYDK